MRVSSSDAPAVDPLDESSIIAGIEQAITGAAEALRRLNEVERLPGGRSPPVDSDPARSPAGLSKAEAIDLAVQTWRFARRVDALDADKFPRERKQFSDSLRRFQKILEAHQIEVLDPVGQRYVEGWVEVEVISWEPPPPSASTSVSTIKQTIAPIVRRNGEIIARGQVVATDVAL
jgi:hypothetical protein